MPGTAWEKTFHLAPFFSLIPAKAGIQSGTPEKKGK
jgi:hypothetical protein